jgi:hypothetical protein
MPKYFTGTYNRAGGAFMVYPSPDPENPSVWVVNAKLKIGGFLVREFNDDPDPGGPMSMNLGAVFDSTHFLHGTNLAITCEVTDNWGRVYSKTKSAPVKNRALLYEHPDNAGFPSAMAVVNLFLAGQNYQVVQNPGSSWSPATVYQDMHDMSLCWFTTHGAVNEITAGNNAIIHQADVGAERVSVSGPGFPPFNSTGKPTTQFTGIVACNVGRNSNFTKWFWPYWTGYSEWAPNQASFTFSGLFYFNDSADIALELWTWLYQGCTIGDSQEFFVVECVDRSNEIPPYIRYRYEPDPMRSVLYLGDVPVYGDQTMRVKSVYTGDHRNPVGWYR